MKNHLLVSAFVLCILGASAQNRTYKFGVTSGPYIQHYNGNLGNSFFQFKTTCFGGSATTLGMYLNKSFDINVGGSIGHFGYCQTEADAARVVALELRCPGCTDRLGMGELRSLMISGNLAVKYKFANDFFLKESSKLAPYVYLGAGINRLSDNMKKRCVNIGNHFSINGGVGVKYNINNRFNVGYNLAVGCFITKKVYYINSGGDLSDNDEEVQKIEKRKDFYMQNTLFVGVNF